VRGRCKRERRRENDGAARGGDKREGDAISDGDNGDELVATTVLPPLLFKSCSNGHCERDESDADRGMHI
jgi:hypothetical protein